MKNKNYSRSILLAVALHALLLFSLAPLGAEKITTLDAPLVPSGLYIHNGRLFIADFPKIHIYSMKNYRLSKSFGRNGEGPGEFMSFVRLHFQGDRIIFHSNMWLTTYSTELQMQKQQRVPEDFHCGLRPLGAGFVTSDVVRRPGSKDSTARDTIVSLNGGNLEKIKELYRQPYYFNLNKSVNAIYLPEAGRRSGVRFFVAAEKIFIEGEDGETGNIYVFDKTGKKLYTISYSFPRLKVTPAHVRAAEDYFALRRRGLFSLVKKRKTLSIPDYFPAIHYLFVKDGRIYVSPYRLKEEKNQFFIFDLEGKLIKEVLVPVKKQDMFTFYPMTISNGFLYQLCENQEEDEDWELHRFPL